jgi:hypothetical protein
MTTPTGNEVHFKDFTKKAKRIVFQLDTDHMEARSVLPVPVMQELIRVSKGLQGDELGEETLGKVLSIFDLILLKDSAALFRSRVESVDNPVDLTQVMDVMVWLMEMYGQRPTTPSSDSSDGLPTGTDGTISTAGVPSIA